MVATSTAAIQGLQLHDNNAMRIDHLLLVFLLIVRIYVHM